MPVELSLKDWFYYSDRDSPPMNTAAETMVLIEKFWKADVNEFSDADWRREEWSIHSALVSLDQLEAAAGVVPSTHYLRPEVGWGVDDEFGFGDQVEHGTIQAAPLILATPHPVTNKLVVELSREFIVYHALLNRNSTEYSHPIDNIVVARAEIDTHGFYDPTASVIVHRDYLRDFLAATRTALIICIVADRFANALATEDLQIGNSETKQIDEHTWLATNVHPPETTGHSYFRGRSSLYRNIVIRPYDGPKFDRNPWPYFGEHSVEEEPPSFIVNSEGLKRTLPTNTYLPLYMSEGIGQYGYLYFRPEVLQKYLNTPGYSVFFHMRNWGVVSLPGDKGTIDVGINSAGMVNAFAPHIGQLTISEQAYWSSFSSLPSGEICDEMFQTRMQQKPPHSPGLTDTVEVSMSKLSEAFQRICPQQLFSGSVPSKENLRKLSVGPVTDRDDEVLELAKMLFGWVIETMETNSLRAALTVTGATVDKKLRQIKLLEKLLTTTGMPESQARSTTAPLVGLNELRIGSASGGLNSRKALNYSRPQLHQQRQGVAG